MSTITPEYIATWPAPNYVNPETEVDVILGLEIPVTTVMVAFLCARLYGKALIKTSLYWDDWVMLLAGVITLTTTLVNCIATRYGTGYHTWDMREEWFIPTAKMALVTQLLYPASASLTKISICMTYLRLFPSKRNYVFSYLCIMFCSLWGIATFFAMLFQCSPIHTYWEFLNPLRKCYNEEAALVTTGVLNSVSDFAVFMWPAQFLWSLKFPLKQRISLIMTFCIGCIVCIAGVIRIWYLTVYFSSPDVTYYGAVLISIAAVETNLAVICGCLPGCKPLLKRLTPCFFSATEDSQPLGVWSKVPKQTEETSV